MYFFMSYHDIEQLEEIDITLFASQVAGNIKQRNPRKRFFVDNYFTTNWF